MKRYSTEAAALAATCIEHNVKGCATCNKVDGECDFGDCQRPATASVKLLDAGGTVGEIRPSCARHVLYMRQGAPYGVAA